jgi:chloramphenicol-sensitive protein RarD
VSGEVQPAPPTDRVGVLAGVGAYSLWGVFPLVFHRLRSVGALEILMHRVLWSFVLVVVLLAFRRRAGWLRPALTDHRLLGQVVAATVLIAINWLVYVWAVNADHVVEAALGYYVNPLLTVGLGVVVLRERLRRLQVAALSLGALSVAVLAVALGRPPWIALALAVSFAGYGFLKKAIPLEPLESLALETGVLLPIAIGGLAVLEWRGTAALGHGSAGRDVLLVGLGVVTALPLFLFATAARRIPLSVLGLLQYLTPSLQLACGVVVLGEPLPPARLAGFVIVWVALALLGVDAVRASRRAGRAASVPVTELA